MYCMVCKFRSCAWVYIAVFSAKFKIAPWFCSKQLKTCLKINLCLSYQVMVYYYEFDSHFIVENITLKKYIFASHFYLLWLSRPSLIPLLDLHWHQSSRFFSCTHPTVPVNSVTVCMLTIHVETIFVSRSVESQTWVSLMTSQLALHYTIAIYYP